MYRITIVVIVLFAPLGTANAAPTEKDKKLLEEVSARLLAVAAKPEGFEWDKIDIGFEDDKAVNAYATFVRKDGKRIPMLRVTEGMMEKVIESTKVDAADRLAYILGHELGHIIHGHVIANPERDKTPFLRTTFGRAEEVEADLTGFKLMLAAGYSFEKGMKVITRMQELKLDYSSFEGRGIGHPSWNDRAVKADKDKATLWMAMSAFSNGVLFLATEDYANAVIAFEKVTKEFPGAHEVWANLGYAQLMHYCDKWDAKDYIEQGIGHVVIGAFYTRIDSVKVRKKDKELWNSAVGNLRKANELKPGQTIILANLGLAYLLHPAGKNVAEAKKFFDEAAKAAEADKNLDPSVRAMLLINHGVSVIAEGDIEKGLARLDEGEKLVRSFVGPATKIAPNYDSALLYTRAMVLAGKEGMADRQKAHDLLETYLRTTSQLSLVWDAAYQRYSDICTAIGKEAKKKEAFKQDRPEPARLVTGVKIKDKEITLANYLSDVTAALGPAAEIPVMPNTAMVRVRYEKEGVEFIATDEVVAIILVGPNAPAIQLKGQTVGAGGIGELKVGMTTEELEAIAGSNFTPCELTEARVYYRSYRELGIAVRVSKGKVTELVIVRAPK